MLPEDRYEWDYDLLVTPKPKTITLPKPPKDYYTQYLEKLDEGICPKEDDFQNQGEQSNVIPNITLPSEHFDLDASQNFQPRLNRFDGSWLPHKLENNENEQDLISVLLHYNQNSEDQNQLDANQKKQVEKQGKKIKKEKRPREKGLRNLSVRCYQIVKRQRETNYKLVSEVLIRQMKQNFIIKENQEKNLCRRVYDILNVFLSLRILHMQNKVIKFVGKKEDRTSDWKKQSQEKLRSLLVRKDAMKLMIKEKNKKIEEMRLKAQKIRELVERNSESSEKNPKKKINLPFVAVIVQGFKKSDMKFSKKKVSIHTSNKYEFFGEANILSQLDLKTKSPEEQNKPDK